MFCAAMKDTARAVASAFCGRTGGLEVLTKTKRVRLKGKALRELNAAIHERDNHRCIACTKYVDPGEKFHHEPGGADKSNEIEKGVLLCYKCHHRRHFGPGSQEIKTKAEEYLRELYE